MERYSDRAIKIINALYTELLDYESEFLPLIECANQCKAYEDTGLEPEQVKALGTKMKQIYSGTAEDMILDMMLLADHVECEKYRALGTVEELTALVKARDEGLLPKLPCKVGDTIYVIPSKANFELNRISNQERNRVYEQIVSSVNWYHNARYLVRTCDDFCSVLSSEYGVTWFLTRAEAEAALSDQEGGPHEADSV